MQKSILSAVIIFLCFSCQENELKENTIKIDLDKSSEVKMSQLFEEVDYLLVLEQDSLPIVQPYKVVFNDSLAFIEDNQLDNLFIVGLSDGVIRHVLESAGSGPGEFNYIEDFQVVGNKIIIRDSVSGKFISFDIEGNYLGEERIENTATNFYKGDNFIIHYFNLKPNEYGFNFLTEVEGQSYLFDTTKSVFKDMPQFNLDNGFQWDFENQEIFLSNPNLYTINFFNQEGIGKRSIAFDFGKNSLPDDQRIYYSNGAFKENPDSFDDEFVGGINRFFSFRDFYFMLVTNGKSELHMLFLDQEFTPFFQTDKMVNDIDGLDHGNTPRFTTDEHLVVMTRSNRLYNTYQKVKEQLTEEYPSAKIHGFVDQITDKLYDDRLAFVFYKLKPKDEIGK